jgi:hypothetical protein
LNKTKYQNNLFVKNQRSLIPGRNFKYFVKVRRKTAKDKLAKHALATITKGRFPNRCLQFHEQTGWKHQTLLYGKGEAQCECQFAS